MSLCVISHDSEELRLVNLAILVEIEFVYHGLPGNKGRYILAGSGAEDSGYYGSEEELTIHRLPTGRLSLLPHDVDFVGLSSQYCRRRTAGTLFGSPPLDLAPVSARSLSNYALAQYKAGWSTWESTLPTRLVAAVVRVANNDIH